MLKARLVVGTKETRVNESQEISGELLLDIMSVMLNPWMDTEENYKISIDEENDKWVCEHYVGAYDGLSGYLYGYGDTVKESLDDCVSLLSKLKSEYKKIKLIKE